eukprot:70352-Chlamydomonas_euryale.AAC.2
MHGRGAHALQARTRRRRAHPPTDPPARWIARTLYPRLEGRITGICVACRGPPRLGPLNRRELSVGRARCAAPLDPR